MLFVSTPVGPLGSGVGGGVELTIQNLIQVLASRSHHVRVAAPLGSRLPGVDAATFVQIPGSWQPTAQSQSSPGGVVFNSALSNAWEYARQYQKEVDLIVNFAYDWLPFYLTPFFETPIAHFVSMSALSDSTEPKPVAFAIGQVAQSFPGTIGSYTRSQADSFCLPIRWEILGGAIALSQYQFQSQPSNYLAWVGRIAPEKGLEDAIAAVIQSNHALKIFGKLEHPQYWQSLQPYIQQASSNAPIQYCGFLPTSALQAQLGKSKALIMTPKWLEAFGLVTIEALACGVPVISYNRGGPGEIIENGRTGWLVEQDNINGLVSAIASIPDINRALCRQWAEKHYSLSAWGKRFERWFNQIINDAERPD